MIAALRSSLAFIGLLLLAVWFVPLGSHLLHQVVIGDQVISLPFGWLSWPDLLAWLYYALCFFGLGTLLGMLGIVSRPVPWALTLGVCFSLIRYWASQYWFSDTAHWSAYLWSYGELLVPPLAAMAGAVMVHRRSAMRTSHGAAAC